MRLPRLIVVVAAVALLLLAVAALPAQGATVGTVTLPAIPAQLWANSKQTVTATTSEAAPAGSAIRLTLSCGAGVAVAVSPPGGHCLDKGTTSFDFTLQAGALPSGATCTFALLQDVANPFYNSLPAQSAAVSVVAQRTLAVSPASSAGSPILAGTNVDFQLTFTPSADLLNPLQVEMQCSELASPTATPTVQMKASPASVSVTMGAAVGFVTCTYTVIDQVGKEELAAPPPSFFQIVPPVQLVATGIPAAGAVVSGDVPNAVVADADLTVSVEPPSQPLEFTLSLACPPAMPISLTFTEATTTAQTLTFKAPAAPADGASTAVQCFWSATGPAQDQRRVTAPPPFNFYVGADIVVTAAADFTQMSFANPMLPKVTVSAPAGTVLSGPLIIVAECSEGFMGSSGGLPSSGFQLTTDALSSTLEYYYPQDPVPSPPVCTFTPRPVGEYRRVKAAIASITFDMGELNIRETLVMSGLPTATDAITVEDVPGMVSLEAAAAGLAFSLSRPLGMAAGVTIKAYLQCESSFGSSVSVTPAEVPFTSASTESAVVTVTVSAPTIPDAHSDRIECQWNWRDRTSQAEAIEFFKIARLPSFRFWIGEPVQLEVRVVDGPQLDAIVAAEWGDGAETYVALQSVGDMAAAVGGAFDVDMYCSPCGVAGATGGVDQAYTRIKVDATPFPKSSPNSIDLAGLFPGDVECRWSFAPGSPWSGAFLLPPPTQIRVQAPVMLEVKGMPTAADVIPFTGYYLERALAPGDKVTITTGAVPADFDFGAGGFVEFYLSCYDLSTYSDVPVVSNGGLVLYDAASRGPHTLEITMPAVAADRPMQISCYWGENESSPKLKLGISIDDDTLFFVVAASPTTLAVRAPADVYVDEGIAVVFEPSQTLRLPKTYLTVDTVCALSAPLQPDNIELQPLGITELQGTTLTASAFSFRSVVSDYAATLTANTADPALQFGYILRVAEPITLTCTHTIEATAPLYEGTADRVVSIAPDHQTLVLNVLPTQYIGIEGMPFDQLPSTSQEITIAVSPYLNAGSIFTPEQTLEVTLVCPGLDLPGGGLLNFTGTGDATILSKSISFTPPAAGPGGNIWLCMFTLGGTDGARFSNLVRFRIQVGDVKPWSAHVKDKPATMYVDTEYSVVLTPPSCMPAAGTLSVDCYGGARAGFPASYYDVKSVSLVAGATSFTFGVRTFETGIVTCGFSFSGLAIGAPDFIQPISFDFRPKAKFIFGSFPAQNAKVSVPIGRDFNFTVAPSEAPGAGGVTLKVSCGDLSLRTSAPFLHWQEGSAAAQTVVISNPSITGFSEIHCYIESTFLGDFAHYFHLSGMGFYVLPYVQGGMDVVGFDAVAPGADPAAPPRITSPDACGSVNFTVALTGPPPAGGNAIVTIECDNFQLAVPQGLVFTYDNSMRPQTVTIHSPGFASNDTCYLEGYTLKSQKFDVYFGTRPTVAVDMPSFLPRGTVAADVTVSTSEPVAPFVSLKMTTYCSRGVVLPDDFIIAEGKSSIALRYKANAYSDNPQKLVRDLPTPVPMGQKMAAPAVQSAPARAHQTLTVPLKKQQKRQQKQKRQPTEKKSRRSEKKAQRKAQREAQKQARREAQQKAQQRARQQPAGEHRARSAPRIAAVPMAVTMAAVAVGAAEEGEVVQCEWELLDDSESRFAMTTPVTRTVVGTPVNFAASFAPEVNASSVAQGSSVALAVQTSAALPVDVAVSVECSSGVTPEPATFVFAKALAAIQTVTLTVAADAPLGAASCTMMPIGPGRLALLPATPAAFTVVQPPPVPSSTGGDSADSSSGSDGGATDPDSTGGDSVDTSSSSSAGGGAADSDSTGSDSVESSTGGGATEPTSTGGGEQTASGSASSSSSSSSTGDDGADNPAASSSSTGPDPCGDFECGALAALSMPNVAACVSMLLATAFAQRN